MNTNTKNYAVVVTYSFDPDCYCKLFKTREEAIQYTKWDMANERRIEVEENGFHTYVYENEDIGEFKLTVHEGISTTTWRVVPIIHDVQGS